MEVLHKRVLEVHVLYMINPLVWEVISCGERIIILKNEVFIRERGTIIIFGGRFISLSFVYHKLLLLLHFILFLCLSQLPLYL